MQEPSNPPASPRLGEATSGPGPAVRLPHRYVLDVSEAEQHPGKPVTVRCPECNEEEQWTLGETGAQGTGYCRKRLDREIQERHGGIAEYHPEWQKRQPSDARYLGDQLDAAQDSHEQLVKQHRDTRQAVTYAHQRLDDLERDVAGRLARVEDTLFRRDATQTQTPYDATRPDVSVSAQQTAPGSGAPPPSATPGRAPAPESPPSDQVTEEPNPPEAAAPPPDEPQGPRPSASGRPWAGFH